MWPYIVPRLRDYYSRKGRKGREGRLVIGDWGTDCLCPAFSGRAHARLRVDAEREGRKIGYWRLGNGLLTSRMRAYVPMCEGNFERRSASAGVLGETAPAAAGRRRAMGWGF